MLLNELLEKENHLIEYPCTIRMVNILLKSKMEKNTNNNLPICPENR